MPEPANERVAAFVLAGGKSSRMGRDKATLPWRGQTLLERALEATRAVASVTHIVGAAARFGLCGSVVEDIFPGRGPLGGIHAALRATDRELNLILAVDLPFVTPALLAHLIQRAQEAPQMAVVPRLKTGWEPLCAVYRKEFLTIADGALGRGQNAIHPLLEDAIQGDARLGILAIDEQELANFGFSSRMFRNVNTATDLEAFGKETAQL